MASLICHATGAATPWLPGESVLDASRRLGVGLDAPCAGKGLCGKCHVRVLPPGMPPSDACRECFSADEIDQGWRLACQMRNPPDGVDARVDFSASANSGRRLAILTTLRGRAGEADDPPEIMELDLPPPSLDDQRTDFERLADASGRREPHLSANVHLSLLRELPSILRRANWRVTAVWQGARLLHAREPDTDCAPVGLAIDLGTTTIAGILVDLATGQNLAVSACANPQAAFGDDVISRIEKAALSEENRRQLASCVVAAINRLMEDACGQAGLRSEAIHRLSVAGNTTMHHLLLGLDTRAIAAVPFVSTFQHGWEILAGDLGLAGCPPGTPVLFPPNISAYVGGDIVAGLLACGLREKDHGGGSLFVDIGTNGEMALAIDGRIFACSAAAGPAFEGARIRCGMRAVTGAISTVELGPDDIRVSAIDGAPPVGLCGTGLLDAVAALLDAGVLDETGRLLDADEYAQTFPNALPGLSRRLAERDGMPAFVLAFPASRPDGVADGAADGAADAEKETPAAKEVFLTQRDIREFQLAKGAIAAGAQVLLEEAGATWQNVGAVWLAGGFGNWLRPRSALRVGLFDSGFPIDRIHFLGNTALAGARLYLISRSEREAAERMRREVLYRELSGKPAFQQAFAEQMLFPDS